MANDWATSAGDPRSKIGIDLHMDLTGARSDVVLSVISGVLLMRRVVGARALDERKPTTSWNCWRRCSAPSSTPG